jgi:hypothetical protein
VYLPLSGGELTGALQVTVDETVQIEARRSSTATRLQLLSSGSGNESFLRNAPYDGFSSFLVDGSIIIDGANDKLIWRPGDTSGARHEVWHEGNVPFPSRRVFRTASSSSGGSTSWYKIGQIELDTRYHDYTATLLVQQHEQSSAPVGSQWVTIKVKQQDALGSVPAVEMAATNITTETNMEWRYTISALPSISRVTIWVQQNRTYARATGYLIGEDGDGEATWYTEESASTPISPYAPRVYERPDYEAGTWTPNLETFSSKTSVTATGQYTKIGNRVYYDGRYRATLSGGSGSSIMRVNGLPFTCNVSAASGAFAISTNLPTTTARPVGGLYSVSGTSYLNCYRSGPASAFESIFGSQIPNGSATLDLYFWGHYRTTE